MKSVVRCWRGYSYQGPHDKSAIFRTWTGWPDIDVPLPIDSGVFFPVYKFPREQKEQKDTVLRYLKERAK